MPKLKLNSRTCKLCRLKRYVQHFTCVKYFFF